MRATILVVLVLTVSGLGTAAAADLRTPADLRTRTPSDVRSPADGERAVPVLLAIGEVRLVARTANVVSPIRNPICDNVVVATVVHTPDGPAFRGGTPGKTLCSVSGGAVGARQLFEITVR